MDVVKNQVRDLGEMFHTEIYGDEESMFSWWPLYTGYVVLISLLSLVALFLNWGIKTSWKFDSFSESEKEEDEDEPPYTTDNEVSSPPEGGDSVIKQITDSIPAMEMPDIGSMW